MVIFLSFIGGLTAASVLFVVVYVTKRSPLPNWLELLQIFCDSFVVCGLLSVIDARLASVFIFLLLWLIPLADNRKEEEEKIDVMAFIRNEISWSIALHVTRELFVIALVFSPMFLTVAYPVTDKTHPREDICRKEFYFIDCLLWWWKTGEICEALY